MYPKWITRAPGIGAVLVLDAKEEQALHDDWDAVLLEQAESAADAAKAAQEQARLVLGDSDAGEHAGEHVNKRNRR